MACMHVPYSAKLWCVVVFAHMLKIYTCNNIVTLYKRSLYICMAIPFMFEFLAMTCLQFLFFIVLIKKWFQEWSLHCCWSGCILWLQFTFYWIHSPQPLFWKIALYGSVEPSSIWLYLLFGYSCDRKGSRRMWSALLSLIFYWQCSCSVKVKLGVLFLWELLD